jgi:hypothetical protein
MKKQTNLITFLPCLCIFLTANMAFGQKYSNEFLAIGVGARAHGMSGAQTAITNDLSAAYWNPAGLTSIEAPFQVNAMHAEWFAGVGQYDYLGFGKSLNKEKKSFIAFITSSLEYSHAILKFFKNSIFFSRISGA